MMLTKKRNWTITCILLFVYFFTTANKLCEPKSETVYFLYQFFEPYQKVNMLSNTMNIF